MFLGRYEHSINGQGRTSIPAKFREELRSVGDDRLIITNLEECLVAYPAGEWQGFMDRLKQLPQTSKEFTEFLRFFVSGAQECPIYKQGRTLIPPSFSDHTGISREIVLVGMLNKIEIWARDKWEREFDQSKDNFGANSQRLSELGL